MGTMYLCQRASGSCVLVVFSINQYMFKTRVFSGVVSGISSIRVCDEVCFCVWLDVVGCDLLSDTFRKTQTTQTGNASHNLSRYVLPTRACGSRPSLSLPLVASCCRSRLGVAIRKFNELTYVGTSFFPNKDRSKSLQPRLKKVSKKLLVKFG